MNCIDKLLVSSLVNDIVIKIYEKTTFFRYSFCTLRDESESRSMLVRSVDIFTDVMMF